jgi:hypothetical protein
MLHSFTHSLQFYTEFPYNRTRQIRHNENHEESDTNIEPDMTTSHQNKLNPSSFIKPMTTVLEYIGCLDHREVLYALANDKARKAIDRCYSYLYYTRTTSEFTNVDVLI